MKPAPDTNEAGKPSKEIARESGAELLKDLRSPSIWGSDGASRVIEAYGVACMKAALIKLRERFPHTYEQAIIDEEIEALK